jgi:hypothetical protein
MATGLSGALQRPSLALKRQSQVDHSTKKVQWE